MGNSNQRFLTNAEAAELLGSNTWLLLRSKLEALCRGGYIDYPLFYQIISKKYEKIPRYLCECLYKAFSSDIDQSIEVDALVSVLAVVLTSSSNYQINKSISSNDHREQQQQLNLLLCRIMFRVYEIGGVLVRRHMEEILIQAYGERAMKRPAIEVINDYTSNIGEKQGVTFGVLLKRYLDALFDGHVYEMTLRKFEQVRKRVTLELFVLWIRQALNAFTEDISQTRIYNLECKYSSIPKAQKLMKRYRLPVYATEIIRENFYRICRDSRTAKAELDLTSWLAEVSKSSQHGDMVAQDGKPENLSISCDDSHSIRSTIDKKRSNSLSDSMTTSTVNRSDVNSEGYFINSNLAEAIFRAKVDAFKPVWRLYEFVEFCIEYGLLQLPEKAHKICTAFVQQALYEYWREQEDRKKHNDSMDIDNIDIEIPTSTERNTGITQDKAIPSEDIDRLVKTAMLKMLLSLARINVAMLSSRDNNQHLNMLPSALVADFKVVGDKGGGFQSISLYTKLIVDHADVLPGLQDLSLIACCRFGVLPPYPLLEKEYITELTLRYVQQHPQAATRPHGEDGTEWCIIPKAWFEKWRRYVGQTSHLSYVPSTAANTQPINDGMSTFGRDPTTILDTDGRYNSGMSSLLSRPGAIDMNSIILKGGAKEQLIPSLKLGYDVEIVSPVVFLALRRWYGGGDPIIRKVIPVGSDKKCCELELHPICVRVCTCDKTGRTHYVDKAMLFSKVFSVRQMTEELSDHYRIDIDQIRLWNYKSQNWKEQFILSPDMTLSQANIDNGQLILMEVSLPDGTWPRSQLYAVLDNEEREPQESDDSTSSGDADDSEVKPIESENDKLSNEKLYNLNTGEVGMYNLGNTCYMNSSVQSLLHTPHLATYFLTEQHMQQLNRSNKHGYQGRLAMAFGALARELWNSQDRCISPKLFMKEVASLRDQFAGTEQHDAHELLAFLLDGLSEDLNLVHEKPYTEQPDSDGRPDAEVADIWWANHLRRDRSVIQALFTGQFKSTMTCSACGKYESARFEPFNFLTVPIPEETFQVVSVAVFPLNVQDSIVCAVKVNKAGTLHDLVAEVMKLGIITVESEETENSDSDAETIEDDGKNKINCFFQACELMNSRIKSFNSMERRIDSIYDSEHLALFQIRRMPGSNSHFNAYQSTNEQTASQINCKAAEVSPACQQFIPDTLYCGPGSEKLVRVAFLQRRVRIQNEGRPLSSQSSFSLGAISNTVTNSLSGLLYSNPNSTPRNTRDNVEDEASTREGVDYIVLEPFGLSLLEVLPSRVSCAALYRLVALRLGSFLKASIQDLVAHQSRQMLSQSSSFAALQDITEEGKAKSIKVNGSDNSKGDTALADQLGEITSVSTDEVMGGAIPKEGFALRLINGGPGSGTACSQCHWRKHCQGCILPDCPDTWVSLRDGESIAVDWHYVVYEDLLDVHALTHLRRHATMIKEQAAHTSIFDIKTPIKECLDKFTEQEGLDDIVCPKCKESGSDHVKRNFSLWRLPPILVVQLKRFQFDRHSRRKLNNRIEFPFNDFDLKSYLAPFVEEHQQSDDEIPDVMKQCTVYDLYSVIHHVGAMGGGHYVATIRQPQDHPKKQSPHARSDGSSTIKSIFTADDQWFCYNDNIVSEITNTAELAGPSAYVMFYIRRDAQHLDFKELFEMYSVSPQIGDQLSINQSINASNDSSRPDSEVIAGDKNIADKNGSEHLDSSIIDQVELTSSARPKVLLPKDLKKYRIPPALPGGVSRIQVLDGDIMKPDKKEGLLNKAFQQQSPRPKRTVQQQRVDAKSIAQRKEQNDVGRRMPENDNDRCSIT